MGNIALNKPTTASNSILPYTPSKAVDGNLSASNRWLTDQIPATLMVDTQARYLVNRWVVKHPSIVGQLTWNSSNYANVDYSYDNRYFLNAAMSVDGSSRFGNETKSGFNMFGHSWGVFPSINGAWLASSEQFMSYLPAINLLKVRAGYGITGNDDIEDYQTMAYFAAIRLKGIANGLVISTLANPSIQWETTGEVGRKIQISGNDNPERYFQLSLHPLATGWWIPAARLDPDGRSRPPERRNYRWEKTH